MQNVKVMNTGTLIWILIIGCLFLLIFLSLQIVNAWLRKKYGTPYRVLLLYNRYNVLETYYCQNEEKANSIYEQLIEKTLREEGISVRKQKISIFQYINSTK